MRTRFLFKRMIVIFVIILAAGIGLYYLLKYHNPLKIINQENIVEEKIPNPEELTQQYFSGINDEKYGELYGLLTAQSQGLISREDYIAKHEKIYDGIDASDIILSINSIDENESQTIVDYSIRMDTIAGQIRYQSSVIFDKNPESGEYLIEWSPQFIFPNLNWNDTVKVKTIIAKRGQIFDCNGVMLAGEGEASSVGLVPGKMRGGSLRTDSEQNNTEADDLSDAPKVTEIDEEERELDFDAIAGLLDMSVENVHKKLSASWVKDDVFVPLKTISKDEHELEEKLLEIPGIKITTVTVRYYPLAEKASHLIGYIQNVTAEDLETYKGEGYTANSVLGKAGLERIYEEQLRARDGYEIGIYDSNGDLTETLAKKEKIDGQDLYLTINADIQNKLYDQFSTDKSCSAAINPKTGAVLALVSTPSYNDNDFVLGMSEIKWNALNEDESNPLYNRFRAALCPGSTMKPITAAIGLNTGILSPDDDFGRSGLSWQKDGSWGGYYITTMTEYDGPANIENALVYSDNIFSGKAALKIGADTFASELKRIGFEDKIPFEYGLYSSIISSTEDFSSEIQLADSGFGQGQILMNPVHMAVIYASFINNGKILQPQLLNSDFMPKVWIDDAFTPQTASIIRDDLVQVIERGTGKSVRVPGVLLAGKTGTAEIKQSKNDISGTELGWYVLFSADENEEQPLLVVSMVEDVKERGGSHYLAPKIKSLFENN